MFQSSSVEFDREHQLHEMMCYSCVYYGKYQFLLFNISDFKKACYRDYRYNKKLWLGQQ